MQWWWSLDLYTVENSVGGRCGREHKLVWHFAPSPKCFGNPTIMQGNSSRAKILFVHVWFVMSWPLYFHFHVIRGNERLKCNLIQVHAWSNAKATSSFLDPCPIKVCSIWRGDARLKDEHGIHMFVDVFLWEDSNGSHKVTSLYPNKCAYKDRNPKYNYNMV